MKKMLVVMLFLSAALSLQAITLEECKSLARKRSPLVKHFSSNKLISSLESDAINTNYLPQLTLEGTASYQSDVVSLPIKLPGINVSSPNNDQYQLSINLSQTIWDGGITKNNLDIEKILLELNNANTEARLYKLNEIINSLYFGVLMIDKNIDLIRKSQESLRANLTQISSLVENGVLLPSNRKSIEIEITRLESKIEGLKKDRAAAVASLEYWIGENIDSNSFEMPNVGELGELSVERPEMRIFDASIALNNEAKDMATSSIMPKIGFFGKFGYGNPNQFNFLEEGWQGYYMVGIKLNWTIFDWMKSSRKSEIASIKSSAVEYDKADFVRNVNISAVKDKYEIEKLLQSIDYEQKILSEQTAICNEKFAQLKNGTATATEYIIEQNKMSQSEINIALQQINIEFSKINLLNKYGK